MDSLLLNLFIIGFLASISLSEINGEKQSFLVHNECSANLTLRNSTFLEAADNPDDPQFRKECIWKIKVNYQDNIVLVFHSLETEETDDCSSNYVAVRDGEDAESPLMGIFCGNKTPPSLRTVEHAINVKFVNNNPKKMSKFSATAFRVPNECNVYERPAKNSFILPDGWRQDMICGGTFHETETKGTITSPCFPGYYATDKNCIWNINAPPNALIRVNFKKMHLNINERKTCDEASVQIMSMSGTDILKNHGTFCGSNLPNSILSEGNNVQIIFKSKSGKNVKFTGFIAEFSHEMK